MSEQTSTIISKVWGMCNPLRDDGVSYGDYLEQLTYLIFLKMSDEYSRPPYQKETGIPEGYTWSDMNMLKGAELEEQYKATLEKLGEQSGILGKIFKGATNKISNAAILYRVVQMIDGEKWVSMSSDVKGEIYEGLLQKNAEDIKSGAGQYFTPRPLIHAMVRCVRPEPMKTIADPCCGSGGFFLAAQSFLANPEHYTLDREQKAFLKNETFYGNELVGMTFKMALMNLYLHNIGDIYGTVPITLGDALLMDPGYRVDYCLTNPPFGKKSSMTFTNEEGEQEEDELVYNRQDFWTTTSNKQLNFLQHINTGVHRRYCEAKEVVVVHESFRCCGRVRIDSAVKGTQIDDVLFRCCSGCPIAFCNHVVKSVTCQSFQTQIDRVSHFTEDTRDKATHCILRKKCLFKMLSLDSNLVLVRGTGN